MANETGVTREGLLEDYRAELAYAKQMKENGATTVSAMVAGTENDVTIDEYIERWACGIEALKGGADVEEYNY